jgi:hypothetical protein
MFEVANAETTAATAAVDAARGRRRVFERTRDRRNILAIHDAWHAALCHRAAPAVFPVTPAARPWVDWTLVDLARRHLELIGLDPHELSLSQLCRMALDRGGGVGIWTPITRAPWGIKVAPILLAYSTASRTPCSSTHSTPPCARSNRGVPPSR